MNNILKNKSILSLAVFILIGYLASILLFLNIVDRERNKYIDDMSHSWKKLYFNLKTEFTEVDHVLNSFNGLFQASNFISRDEFTKFYNATKEGTKAVKAIEWIPVVGENERKIYEEEARKIVNDFTFKDLVNNKLVKAKEKKIYYPIYYVEPISTNLKALGLDVSSSIDRLNLIENAKKTKKHYSSHKVSLVQDEFKEINSLLSYKPVFKKTDESSKKEKLIGFIVGVFNIDEIISKSLAHNERQLNIVILDTGANDTSKIIYSSVGDVNNTLNVEKNLFEAKYPFWKGEYEMGQRKGQIYAFPHKNELFTIPSNGWLILIIGIAITTMFVLYIFKIESLVRIKTRELKSALKNSEESEQKAICANKIKSQFLSNMSHEIRTPLTSIIGYAELLSKELKNKTYDTKVNDAILSIHNNGKHLLSLINDILDFSKIEANKLVINNEDTDIIKLANDIKQMLKQAADEKGNEFNLIFMLPMPSTLIVDPVRIKQIIINLCSNAIKFTKDGKVTISISYNSRVSKLNIEVKDTGIGIDSSKIYAILDPFAQADDSTTRKYGGTGLGLSITNNLCKEMNGILSIESEVGVGSTFTATITAKTSIDSEIVSEDIFNQKYILEVTTNKEYECYTNLKLKGFVLLAEDWKDNQDLIAWHLEDLGLSYKVVDNGQDAVNYAILHNPDLILMDIQMPIQDGNSATRELRDKNYTGPIVALTANVLSTEIEEYKQTGFNDWLAKPLETDRFKSLLIKYLQIDNSEESRALSRCYKPTNRHYLDNPKLAKIYASFIEKLPERLEEIKQSVDNESWIESERMVHGLKGVSASYGIDKLTNSCQNVESLFSNGNIKEAKNKVKELYVIIDEAYNENMQNIEKDANIQS